jgi:GntR family transcriptional regulator
VALVAAADEPRVSRAGPAPLYRQIRALLLDEIRSGKLASGDRLPPEREYASALGVSLGPVRQAILGLVKDGYFERSAGRGTFVRPDRVTEAVTSLSGFTESMREKGRLVEMRILRQEVVDASEEVRSALGLARGPVVELCRVASESQSPLALLVSFLDARRFSELLTVDFSAVSLYTFLRERYGVEMTRATNVVQVVHCGPEEAGVLEIPVSSPALEAVHTTFDQRDSPVEVARVLYRADRVRLSFESQRPQEAGPPREPESASQRVARRAARQPRAPRSEKPDEQLAKERTGA